MIYREEHSTVGRAARPRPPLGRLAALFGAAAWAWVSAVGPAAGADTNNAYRSPSEVAYSPDGKWLAVSDRTAGKLALVDAAAGKMTQEVELGGAPAGLAWRAGGAAVFVANYAGWEVAEVSPGAGKVARRFPTVPYPQGLALAEKKDLLIVCGSGKSEIAFHDAKSGQAKGRIPAVHQPFAVAVAPDETLAVVSNLVALGDATDVKTAAALTFVDLAGLTKAADVRLPPGATNCRGVAFSPDGKWVYAVHTLGKTTLPTTQLERGWVNTNALSIIDVKGRSVYATVLLDQLSRGAADPWGVAVSKDGETLWITLSGTHELSRIKMGDLHRLLAGQPPAGTKPDQKPPPVWESIRKDPKERAGLAYDLSALYAAGIIERYPLSGKGPRGVALTPDGKTLSAALYFTGAVLQFETGAAKARPLIPIGKQPAADQARQGEILFHDAECCFQNWLSCATCHPNARADGLNWDLLNDGIGNPKNSRSMLLAGKTPPVMSLGVREKMEVAVAAGFKFIQFVQIEPEKLGAVSAYLAALAPERSPYRQRDGSLTAAAQKGEALYKGKAGCAGCHPCDGVFTNRKLFNVGTSLEIDQGRPIDTPTIVESWRTAPYLHHGRAATMHEVFSKFNPKDQHGATSKLSKDELDCLVEYILSQ